jgi:tripartite-type tricarboxylate transporter receptor subunit TctC
VDGLTIGFAALRSERPELWDQKKLRALLQFGRQTRLPALADVPTAREVAPTADARALIEFAELPFLMSQPFVAPPELPADRAQALQDAFRRMVADPEFIADAHRRKIELSPSDGPQMLAVIGRAAATPRAVIDQFNAFIEPQN